MMGDGSVPSLHAQAVGAHLAAASQLIISACLPSAAPTLLVEPRPEKPRRPRRQRSSGGGGGSSDEGGSSSSEGEDEDDSFSSGGSSGPAEWQVRRSKSWDGHLQDTSTLGDSLPLVGSLWDGNLIGCLVAGRLLCFLQSGLAQRQRQGRRQLCC